MESDAELRAELETAIAKVSRQIEIQVGSRNFVASGPSSRQALIDELQAELSQLKEALAGLEPEETPKDCPPVAQQEGDVPAAAADTPRRGVLIALRGRSVEPVVLGRFLLILGSLGVLSSAAVGLAHFVFGMPVYEGRQTHRLMGDQETLGFLAAFASAFGLAAALGFVVLRDASRRNATNELVR